MTTLVSRRQSAGANLVAAALLALWIPVVALVVPAPEGLGALFWTLLDVAEFVCLATAAWGAWKRHMVTPLMAGAAAFLLLADAIVDVSTATGPADLVRAVAMALLAELPLAIVCADLARQSAAGYPAGPTLFRMPVLVRTPALVPVRVSSRRY